MLASWTFYRVLKGFRSFIAENLGSVSQRAAKLQAVKVWGETNSAAGLEWNHKHAAQV